MKTRLDKSIEYIRGYCEKNDCCSRCKIYDRSEERCSFKRIPLTWETLQERKEKARTSNEN